MQTSRKINYTCALCHVSFSAYKRRGILTFCSRACMARGRLGTKSSLPTKKISNNCLNCSRDFLRYRNKSRPQLFCSRACFLASDYHKAIQRKKMIARNLRGERSPSWKGDDVKYKSLHRWVELQWGKAKEHECTKCHGASGSVTMNWANLDQKYTRERETWAVMCKKCHSRYDQDHFQTYSGGAAHRYKLKELET